MFREKDNNYYFDKKSINSFTIKSTRAHDISIVIEGYREYVNGVSPTEGVYYVITNITVSGICNIENLEHEIELIDSSSISYNKTITTTSDYAFDKEAYFGVPENNNFYKFPTNLISGSVYEIYY
jgi:hypothetical protein